MEKQFQNTIKYLLSGGKLPEITDGERLVNDLKSHALLSLMGTGKAYEKIGLSDSLRTECMAGAYYQINRSCEILKAQQELTELLGNCGIKPVILKGMSVAKYYSEPLLRATGDIDFLLYGDCDFDNTEKLLLDNGYILDGHDDDLVRHVAFEKDGIRYEMHKYFSLNNCEKDRILDKYISSCEPREDEINGVRFYSLPEQETGIMLLEHINHHLVTGLGFRQILDWMCYADKVLTDEFWDSGFGEMCGETGLCDLAKYVTRMCELCFGLNEHEFCREADENICIRLFDEIYASGNFGNKRNSFMNNIYSFCNSGNPFIRLQKGGLARWEAARKHKILRPFAWLYQLLRIVGVLIKRRSPSRIREGIELTQKNDDLMKTLKVGKNRED